MATPLKLIFNEELVNRISKNLKKVYPDFNQKDFYKNIIPHLDNLEFKSRSELIGKQLIIQLPKNYHKAVNICIQSFEPELDKEKDFGNEVFYYMPFGYFAEQRGVKSEHLVDSFLLLEEITKRFTAEFAVRPFLKEFPKETLAFLNQCAKSNNVHIRRFASEGSRPFLPWGMQIKDFAIEPTKVLDILNNLVNDPSKYVQKSVANNLNDISKVSPERVLNFLKQNSLKNSWITKHALRTLVKNGDQSTLKFLGFNPKFFTNVQDFSINKNELRVGENLMVKLILENNINLKERLIVDFIIEWQKSKGKSQKTFKWKTFLMESGKIELNKSISFKPISTRVYYEGIHKILIQINGKILCTETFYLKK